MENRKQIVLVLASFLLGLFLMYFYEQKQISKMSLNLQTNGIIIKFQENAIAIKTKENGILSSCLEHLDKCDFAKMQKKLQNINTEWFQAGAKSEEEIKQALSNK